MARHYPPLNSLLFFVTAARTSSFTLAAEKLFVTRSAVSRQIKGLEEYLGVRLFIRSKSGIALTPEGLAYSNSLSRVFEDIKSATNVLLGEEKSHLKLGISSTFNATWLMSRLSDFHQLHPSLTIDFVTNPLDTIEETIDLRHDSIDAAIRFGHGDWEGCQTDKLLDVYVQLVCAPELLESDAATVNVNYLEEHNWLHYKHLPKLWPQWLESVGIEGMKTKKKNIELDNVAIAVQAAIDGLGIIPMYRPLADPLLDSGRLVIAHPYLMLKQEAYYFVCSENDPTHTPTEIFRTWILSIAKEFQTHWDQEFDGRGKKTED